MDLQKQPILATKEQLRLAEITQSGNEIAVAQDDIVQQKRVKKVIELTRCTQSQAEVALIDSEGNVTDAVSRLLDNPEELVLWSQQQGNKAKKTKAANESKTGGATHGRRTDSQRSRTRNEGNEQQQAGERKQFNTFQSRSARPSQAREQNGPSDGPRTRSERPAGGFKGQGRGGGTYRRDRGGPKEKDGNQRTKSDANEAQNEGHNGWTNGRTGGDWGDTVGWGEEKKMDRDSGFSTVDAEQSATDKDEEWKSGPRVFMPSSTTSAAPIATDSSSQSAKATSNWPALDNFAPAPVAEQNEAVKPKTFAAVAAAKKAPPPKPPQKQPPPPQQQQPVTSTSESAAPMATTTESLQKETLAPQSTHQTKASEEPVVEWTSTTEWGNSLSPQPIVDHQPEFVKHPSEPPASTSSSSAAFASSAHSLNVNQEYTEQLKNAIGLVQSSQPQQQQTQQMAPQLSQSATSCATAADYMHQRIQQLQQQSAELDQPQEKVEFVSGDSLPPTSTSYQFGFHFDHVKENAWAPQQHISSVELDRSVLKSSTGTMLSTMTSIPTTSSIVSAQFNASSQQQQQQQAQSIDSQQQRISNTSSRGANAAALSCRFTDAASVNFPPSNGPTGAGAPSTGLSSASSTGVGQSSIFTAAQQLQQQQNKPMYAPTNASMVAALPHMQQQHIQQQPQATAMFHHQTSAAPTAVPQFNNFNMPYMYSPVPAPPTLPPGPNSEMDRFLLQHYGQPYSQLDLPMGAMSIGPPTTLAPNRATMDSYMDKFGQQQNVGQSGNTGPYQQSQQSQQQRLGQSDTAALLGGAPGHVGPPPGFGMPTAPTQPSYVPQPANLQSLFHMPTYHHPYQHHQYMMSNANRLQAAQRPTQTSPPEGNNGPPQRRGANDPQGYPGSGPGDASGDQHSSGTGVGGGAPSYGQNYNKYRSYMS